MADAGEFDLETIDQFFTEFSTTPASPETSTGSSSTRAPSTITDDTSTGENVTYMYEDTTPENVTDTDGDATEGPSNSITLFSPLQSSTPVRPVAVHECSVCLKKFKRRACLNEHKRRHTGDLFRCESCPSSFTSKFKLRRHEKATHSNVFHECPDPNCGKIYRSLVALQHHKRTHSAPTHLCSFCGRSFHFHDLLKAHLATHTGEKPFTCTQCGSLFTYRTSLSYHIHHLCGVKENIIKCDDCGKFFKTQKCLKEHKFLHKEEARFQCNRCGKFFSHRAGLRKHTFICT